MWPSRGPTCNKDVCLRFLAPRAFIWYPTRPSLGWWWLAEASHHKWAWSLGDPRCHINAFLWFLTSRAFVWYPTWLMLSNFEKSGNFPWYRWAWPGNDNFSTSGGGGKPRGCFWEPVWAPWKWNYIFGNYFPKSSLLCTILLDYIYHSIQHLLSYYTYSTNIYIW